MNEKNRISALKRTAAVATGFGLNIYVRIQRVEGRVSEHTLPEKSQSYRVS